MTAISKLLVGAAVGAGMITVSAVSASAAVVCSRNVCWHTQETYQYPPAARIVVHPDDWRWRSHEHYVFREHEGRGYWRGRHWTAW